MFNRFLVISKSINFAAHLSKWPSKNKGPTRAREVPINELVYTEREHEQNLVGAENRVDCF